VADDHPGVGQVDGKQCKELCHKGVLLNKEGAPKPQAFEIIIFEIGSAVGMDKLG
jgi:hypothetical protein